MSLNHALEALSLAIRDLAAAATGISEAAYYLRPDHPSQPAIRALCDQIHQAAHDTQKLRVNMASGPA